MKDYFIWNGKKSTEYGVFVSEQPPITFPEERSKQTTIPGRPGSLTTLEGDDVYEDLTLTATCFIRDPALIPGIGSWLKGGGKVTFANRPDGYYNARISNQIPFEKILRGNPHCSFAVNFRCSPPFWYDSNPSNVTITTASYILTNPGNVYSEPIISVYGTGDMTLIINETFIELDAVSNGITINSVIQEAYQGKTLLNDKMEGDFPVLKPGNNLISWSGGVTRLVIQPNWRYL